MNFSHRHFSFALTFRIIGIVSLFAAVAAGQQVPIEESEFRRINSEAFRKASERSRRVAMKSERFQGGVLKSSEEYIWEFSVPDRMRTLVRKNENGIETKTETIEIGSVTYERKNDGDWTKRTHSGGGGIGTGTIEFMTQATKEPVLLDGAEAELFEEFRVEKSPRTLTYYLNRFWINNDYGLLMKVERSSGGLQPKTVNYRSESVYFYDANIKIEAPIP
jgi:hypothetical protein